MNPYRTALLGGLLYALPLAVWLLGGLEPAAGGSDLAGAAGILPPVQLAALVLVLPALADAGAAAALGAAALLLVLPWPLLAVLHASGIGAGALLTGQTVTLAAGLALVLLWRLAARARRRMRADLMALLQLVALLAIAAATAVLPGLGR